MNSDILKLLWLRCCRVGEGTLAYSEKSSIPSNLWDALIAEGVVSPPRIPIEVFLPDFGLEGEARLVKIDGTNLCKVLPSDPEYGGTFEIPLTAVEEYPVWQNALARYVANLWEITPEFREVGEYGHLIGWREESTAVVILYQLIGNGISQSKDTLNELNAQSAIVVSIQPIVLSRLESEGLSSDGVSLVDLARFLAADGTPRWAIAESADSWLSNLVAPWSFDYSAQNFMFGKETVPLKKSCQEFLIVLWEEPNRYINREIIFARLYKDTPPSHVINRRLRQTYKALLDLLPTLARKWFKKHNHDGYGVFRP
ncbi:MAG TPA: hypothetical protein VGB30_00850 [bacterium]|jgi:hypothetical protein